MKTSILRFILALTLLSLPIFYFFISKNLLPENVPLHYGADGSPDKYGPPSELLNVLWMMLGIGIFSYFIFNNLDKIDPKSQALQSKKLINKIVFTVIAFIAIIGVYMVYSAHKGVSLNFIFVLMGGLFAILGNFMNNIKPNYFIGIRTPWTLENADTWRETHRLAARLWTPMGIVLSLLAIILPNNIASPIFIGGLATMVLIPLIYSFIHFKQNKVKTEV